MDIKKLLSQFDIIHNGKYDYSLVKSAEHRFVKINIICNKHGTFSQSISGHQQGRGCKWCAIDKQAINKIAKAKREFVEKSNIIHNNFYSYENSDYKKATCLIKIQCPIHGEFELSPNKHLNGRGCQKCAHQRRIISKRKSVGDFIKQANIAHNNKYDYTEVDYKNTDTKVKIICPNHGVFYQNPSHHLTYSGCSSCRHHGFKHNKNSFFYIHEISSNGTVKSYKFGITNYTPKTRQYYQNRLSLYDVTEFFHLQLIGVNAYSLERMVKLNIKSSFLSKDEMPDGYTETINPADIDKLEELVIEYILKNDTI